MKKVALALLLLFSTLALAKSNPIPPEYTINVHVSSARLHGGTQVLNVIIGGKKYKLQLWGGGGELLALGDYKAKLVRDEHKTAYRSLQIYEFLFPDQKTAKFIVIGEAE